MKIFNLEQGSDEWHSLRLGKPTASRFSDIITPATGEKSKSFKKYLFELLGERLAGEKEITHKSIHMELGNEREDDARATYAFLNDVDVEQVGIIFNDDLSVGASPDGLIYANGGLEIKCVKSSTLVEYMLVNKLPTQYIPQVQGNLWISEREWWDFIAYHPKIRLFQVRVYRDDEYIKKMVKLVSEFNDELNEKYERIKNANSN